jgi:predicted N-acetyltransferase YhbS
MITIRKELPKDVAAREALLDLVFGDARFAKPSERLRQGRRTADGLAFTACQRAEVVGTVRFWNVSAGPNRPALLLGPLAVHPDLRSCGIGSSLMCRALDEARRLNHGAVLLVGDEAFYRRFRFSADLTGGLSLPGLDDPNRFLGFELQVGALADAYGPVTATGRSLSRVPVSERTARSRPVQPPLRAA